LFTGINGVGKKQTLRNGEREYADDYTDNQGFEDRLYETVDDDKEDDEELDDQDPLYKCLEIKVEQGK